MTSSEYCHLIREFRKKVCMKILFVARHFKGCFLWLDVPYELALLLSECGVVRNVRKKAGDEYIGLT